MNYRIVDIRNICNNRIPGIETEQELNSSYGKHTPWGIFVKDNDRLRLLCASKSLFNACLVASKLCESLDDAVVMAISEKKIGLAWSPKGKVPFEYDIAQAA